jgi:23S rRNA pseudouridine1911/1915/1917 synthase
MKLDVLYEDNHLLIINKPAGWVTQGALPEQPSVVELAKSFLKAKYQKRGNVFLGVVSRLDRGVTGVLPLAKTSKGAARLNDEFREHRVDKLYWAIVQGSVLNQAKLSHWLVREQHATRSHAVNSPVTGAYQAVLEYERIQSWSDFHLLQIRLETGGKHQIRAQLSAVGCPIVGDKKYGSQLRMENGLSLHCRKLQFRHPTRGVMLTVRAALPETWRSIANFGKNAPIDGWNSDVQETAVTNIGDEDGQ